MTKPPQAGQLRSELDKLLCQGVALEMFEAEQAIRILASLDTHANEINSAGGQGVRFLAQLQLSMQRVMVLQVSRVFESGSRYPLRSIPGVLRFLADNAGELPILDRLGVLEMLPRLGRSFARLPDADATGVLISVMTRDLGIDPRAEALKKLKVQRDKAVVHPEHVERANIPSVNMNHIGQLLANAQMFVGAVAKGYLSGISPPDAARDSLRTVRSFEGLLLRAGLIREWKGLE